MRPNGRKYILSLLAASFASCAMIDRAGATSVLVQKTAGGVTSTLGTLTAFDGGSSAKSAGDYYNYSHHEFNGAAPTLSDDRTHLFFVNTEDNGLSFFVVNDNSIKEGGGSSAINTRVKSSRALKFLVQDDANDIYHGGVNKASKNIRTHQTWFQDRTDGYVLGATDPDESLQAGDTLSFGFSKVYRKKSNHITSWAAYTAEGGLIDLGGVDKFSTITFTILSDNGSDISHNGDPGGLDQTPISSQPAAAPVPIAAWGGFALFGGFGVVKRFRRK